MGSERPLTGVERAAPTSESVARGAATAPFMIPDEEERVQKC